jgi:hypothetical protein
MHPTPGACIKHIVGTSGVRGLFKGYISLVSREVRWRVSDRKRAASGERQMRWRCHQSYTSLCVLPPDPLFFPHLAFQVPFSLLQFPMYEHFKKVTARHLNVDVPTLPGPYVAACGMVAGGLSAAVTTPLDVVKTRTLLDSVRISHCCLL